LQKVIDKYSWQVNLACLLFIFARIILVEMYLKEAT
jgi:hypothetical protein